MSEETQAELSQVATEVIGWLREGKDFVQEQAPELAEQVVTWGIIYFGGVASIWLIVVVLLLCAGRFYWKQRCATNDVDRKLAYMFGVSFAYAGAGFSFLISMCFALDLLKPLLTPKLYVLEQLARLVQ